MGKTNLGRVTFVPRGAYNNETSYKRLDVVEYEGSSYLFLKDSTGITPTGDSEVTMLLAKKGKDFTYDDFTPEQLAALKGADGKDGLKGDKGDPGKGLTILGYYGTLDLLKASVTTPEVGDTYGIGTAAPYDIYVFDSVTSDWVNNGKLSGGGEGGGNSVVFIPSAVLNLTNESPSAEILTAFGGKDAFISIVTQLEKGILPMINIEGVFFQFSLFAAYHDAENNTYTLGFRLADAEVLKINGYEGTNGLVAIVLTNDTASVEIMDIPGNGLNYIAIPESALIISEGSTSEHIIAQLGGIDNIRSIVRSFESGGNSMFVMTAGNTTVPITGVILDFDGDYDSPSFVAMFDILSILRKKTMTLKFDKGVASVLYNCEGHLIADSDLVSDPAVGGIDRPASAAAVKMVNDKIPKFFLKDEVQEEIDTNTYTVDENNCVLWVRPEVYPEPKANFKVSSNISYFEVYMESIAQGYLTGIEFYINSVKIFKSPDPESGKSSKRTHMVFAKNDDHWIYFVTESIC